MISTPSGAVVDVGSVAAAVRRVVGERDGLTLLHGPSFKGNESRYVQECIDTAWVSSAGSYVGEFEKQLAQFTGARYAIAVVNGTAALHIALTLAGVERGDEVLMPSLTFIATANAASYCGAVPHFCDVEERTLGLCPSRLAEHLAEIAEMRDSGCYNRRTGRRIAAVVPMHTFGHPVDLDGLNAVADRWRITIVEDAAESLGSYYHGKHTGRVGKLSILSFNGNKIVTTGAGGAILTDDEALGRRAKHITTTAKLSHAWEFVHDEVGYNYRMPNINAAMGVAQLEQLPEFLRRKRILAERYAAEFKAVGGIRFFTEPQGCRSNYWLNVLIMDQANLDARDRLLAELNQAQLQSRPVWRPMHRLPMYSDCPQMGLTVTEDLAMRIINIPSSAFLMTETQ